MVATPISTAPQLSTIAISWEAVPEDFILEEEPVENTAQPLIAGALRVGYWLRWWDQAGNLLPWAVEKVEQEQQRTEQERQRAEQESKRAEQESQRAERLAEQLRALGIDPID